MYKQLFILLFKIIAESTSAWKQISEQEDEGNKLFYKSYLFPIVGIIALSSFLGVLMSRSFDVHLLEEVLKIVIKQVIVYGGGFYLISYILWEHVFPRFDLPKDRTMAERFTGYGSALIYAVAMVQSLLPSFFLLKILIVYTIYILWTGATHYLKIREDRQIVFVTVSGAVILLAPILIDRLIGMLMPGMR
jgi:hypothetical protein